ncbi:hypothetical protein Hanom_Chr02g00131871 [Helianthus anomalus]
MNNLFPLLCGSNVNFDPLHNSGCDFDVQKNSELAKFSSILEFMGRIPIQKALTDQRPLYKSHIKRSGSIQSMMKQTKQFIQLSRCIMKRRKLLLLKHSFVRL